MPSSNQSVFAEGLRTVVQPVLLRKEPLDFEEQARILDRLINLMKPVLDSILKLSLADFEIYDQSNGTRFTLGQRELRGDRYFYPALQLKDVPQLIIWETEQISLDTRIITRESNTMVSGPVMKVVRDKDISRITHTYHHYGLCRDGAWILIVFDVDTTDFSQSHDDAAVDPLPTAVRIRTFDNSLQFLRYHSLDLSSILKNLMCSAYDGMVNWRREKLREAKGSRRALRQLLFDIQWLERRTKSAS